MNHSHSRSSPEVPIRISGRRLRELRLYLLRHPRLPLRRIVLQQLFDQIHVCHDHASAAVSLTAHFVQGFAVGHFLREEVDVGFPEVGHDLDGEC